MWIYGSILGIPVEYPYRAHGLTHPNLHRSAHAGMGGTVGLEVPESLTGGEVQHDTVCDVCNVLHDSKAKGLR